MRQGLREEDRSVRAPVEATMWCHPPSRTPSERSIKRGLKRGPQGDKLPTRGLERARMVLSGAALMVNMRRLHRWRGEKRKDASSTGRSAAEKLLFFAFLWALVCGRWGERGKKFVGSEQKCRVDISKSVDRRCRPQIVFRTEIDGIFSKAHVSPGLNNSGHVLP